MKNSIWIVVPAYNEAKNISNIIKQIQNYSKNIIIIDDGSSDNTSTIAEKSDVIVLKHIINLGKGAALKTGCDYALKNGAEKIVVLDADTQHDPKDIPRFMENLVDNDIVFGFRKRNKNMPKILAFGNWFINNVIKFLYGVRIIDSQSGYRAFTAKAYKKIRWQSNTYSMESEMIANVGKHKLKYAQIPIETIYGDKYKGTTIIDGVKIVRDMFIWRFLKK